VSAWVLGLLLAAGAMHAAWNLLLKGADDRLLVTWWALLVGSALFLPVLLGAPVPRAIWPFVVASAAVECVYYILLAYAYGQADFSQVYPLARGAAPALLAVWAALVLKEYPSLFGLAGLALIVLGLVPVGGGEVWWRWSGPAFRSRGVTAAFGVALCTSVYSLIDGVAVRRTSAAPYTVAILLVGALLLAPAIAVRYGVRRALAAWRERGRAWRIVALGVLTLSVYTLVLRAYAVAPLAYVGAIREVSVVIAALAGWLWLGERFGARRLAGAVAVFSGIVILAALG
jgi:drug/metabolite transporter (DMT)-like permease